MDDMASLSSDSVAAEPAPSPDWRDTEAKSTLAALGPSPPPVLATADAPLTKLKAAGFSDPEIAQWSTQKRQELAYAGFNDGEIDHYLSGAVQPPVRIPQAVTDRFEGGARAAKLEGGLAQTIPAGIDLLSSPDGRTKLWNGVQEWLKSTSIADSIIDPLTTPGDVAAGKTDLTTPEGLDRAMGLGMFIALGRQSKLPLNGQTSGLALAAGQTIGRIERGPLGDIQHVPVGEMPKGEDFINASHDLTGGVPDQATQQKLLTLYQEQGIHPAEVAHDAKSDVTITQDIVSDNPSVRAYPSSNPNVPPPSPGTIRFYHGTAYTDASEFSGKTFVTPHLQYARDYHGGPNNVLYTDFTLAEAEARGLIDEVNRYPINGSIDDGASLLQPFEIKTGAPPQSAPLRSNPSESISEPIKINNAGRGRGRAAADPATWSLFEFLSKEGGLKPTPDLLSIFGNTRGPFVPGFGPLLRKGGLSMDEALTRAKEGAYLLDPNDIQHVPGNANTGELTLTINDLHDLIANESRGQKNYRVGQTAKERPLEPEHEAKQIIDELHRQIEETSGFKETVDPVLEDRVVQIIQKEGGTDVLGAYERAIHEDADRYEGTLNERQTEAGLFPGWDHVPGEPPQVHGGAVAETRRGAGAPDQGARGTNGEEPRSNGAGTRGASEEGVGGGRNGGKPPAVIEPPEPEPGSFEAAQKKILDKISIGEGGESRWSWKKFYTQMVDDLHPIAAAVKDATGGKELPISEDAYKLARLTRGTFGKAEHMLEHGTFDFATNRNVGPGLKEILAPARDDLNPLRAYLAAKRTIEIESSGRISGLDLEAAKQVVAQSDKLHGTIADKLTVYQNQILAYLKDSGVLSQKSFDAMQAANRDYVPFFRVMGDGVGTGSGRGRGFGPGSPIKALKGSVRDIVDPLESIIKNTYAFVSIAERNAVGMKLIDTLKEADKNPAVARTLLRNPDYKEKPLLKQIASQREPIDGEIVQYLKDNGIKEPPPDLVAMIRTNAVEQDGNAISAFRDGKKESYTTSDTDLVKAFRQLNQHDANLLLKIVALPAKTLRAGAVLTPDFMAKNMIRDFQSAFTNSKGLFSPIDTARGLKSAITKDETFQSWLKSGGANSAMVGIDRRYLQESIEKLTADTGLATRSWNVIKSPLDGLRMVSELTENATRIGEYRKGLGKEGLNASKATQQEAGYASREVTLDFQRRGASIQAYNMITAFANANIQGVDRIGRAFKDRPVNTALKIAGGITLPSVLLWWANHDDERYQNLPRWEKDLFWIVLTKDHIWRIPKDFSLGVVFGSGAEHAMEAWLGSKNVDPKDAFKGFGGSVASSMLPSIAPTIALPVIEQFANRSFLTNRTLVPDNLEKGLPEYQYTPYTTELGKKLGSIIGAFPGISSEKLEATALGGVARSLSSPILIENYVRAWSGGLGMYALQAADATLRKSGVLPDPPKPASTLSDIPFVRAFAVRYPSATAQPIQDFYDEFDKSKRYFTSYMDRAKEGDVAAMGRIEAAGGPRTFVQLDGIKTTLTEHSQLIRDIYKDPEMPSGQKRQLIDQLYYSMIQVGQAGVAAQKQIDTALVPKGAPAQ